MKIFCIGFHKTGTLSLASALEVLGYRCRHGYKAQSDEIEKALYEGKPPLHFVEQGQTYDAYLDIYAVRWFYPLLDEAYPDSKFILTTRDNDKWLESVHRQIEKRPQSKSPWFHYYYHQTDDQRILDKMNCEYGIRHYFKGLEDQFLEIDLTRNSPQRNWYEICTFLDKPIPDTPFPHKNKSL